MKPGLALSIPGMAVALMAYPVYTMVTDKRKKEYVQHQSAVFHGGSACLLVCHG